MERTAFRTCPFCEATCGLAVTVRGDAVVKVRGDADDVFSRGFLCPKGVALKELHEDPDRLRTPLVRAADGELAPAGWEAAWAAIGERLRGEARNYAATIQTREERHTDRLSELIRELGGEPPAGRPPEDYAPQFPRMRTESEALRFAADLEERLVRAHLRALQTLPREDQRGVVAEIAAEEAEDLAAVYALSGEPAAQLPFVTGT